MIQYIYSILSIFLVLSGSFPSSNDVKQFNSFHYLRFQCFSGGKVFVCNVKCERVREK